MRSARPGEGGGQRFPLAHWARPPQRGTSTGAAYLQRAKGVHTVMHQPQVTVRGTVAWITDYWTDERTIDGRRFTSRGKSTRIFAKEDGRWVCIHGHYAAVP